MPSTALDVLSLADAKAQLRITVDDHDALITGHIEAAVDFVVKSTSIPLLDDTYTANVERPVRAEYPVVFGWGVFDIAEVVSVAYWEPTQALREAPTGSIDVADLGRIDHVRNYKGDRWHLWPQAAGWPEVLDDSLIKLELKRSMTEVPPALRTAVLLAVRQLYQGFREIRMTHAMFTFMDTSKREIG